jgi:hypothetical protein
MESITIIEQGVVQVEPMDITLIPVTAENLEEALLNDGIIQTEISIDDEIELLQGLDQSELSRMIPGIHKQGINYDQLKESVVERALNALPVLTPEEAEIEEMRKFFQELDAAVATGSIDGLEKILEDNPAVLVKPKIVEETQVPVEETE